MGTLIGGARLPSPLFVNETESCSPDWLNSSHLRYGQSRKVV